MSYQVLARKWRPNNFQAVIGQQPTVQALINSLTLNQLHHAYLFTGTRGVGKTTLARLLARCVNCMEGVSANPCGQCSTCQAILAGKCFDLIEVDAASRTRVEDTRELLENVQYSPSEGRYKVYIIDEVHMLSGHSFNALLKTLEEPPPHVIFLLATTDPQKLPITVLSRCLQFHLKAMPAKLIKAHLAHILSEENIPFEPDALHPLAYAAKGSMRDALSLLDQAIAYSNRHITVDAITTMLGNTQTADLFGLLRALVNKEAKEALKITQHLYDHGADFMQVLQELLQALHQITLCKTCADITFNTGWADTAQLKTFAQQFSKDTLHRYYQIGLARQQQLAYAPTAHSGFEMLVLEMIATTTAVSSPKENTANEQRAVTSMLPPPSLDEESTINGPSSTHADHDEWSSIVNTLNLSGMTHALATHCTLDKRTDTTLHLTLNPKYKTLLTAKQQAQLADAITAHFKKSYRLEILVGLSNNQTPAQHHEKKRLEGIAKARSRLENDTHVKALMRQFDATIEDNSLEQQE